MVPRERTNLDPERSSFVGRSGDMARLDAPEARAARLVTIHGPPGIGKTRLARELALLRRSAYEGGVWFCDLTEARSGDDVSGALARELGVPLTLGKDSEQLRAQLGSAIAARGEVLIILDNFEHVAGHAAETVGRWMQAAPRAAFVVTSRELLRLQGEVRHELAPLDDADAMALFTDRAQAVRADWAPSGGEAEAAHVLVRRLDGIALAIELAAARMEVLSATQLVERISRSLDLLTSDRRDVPARHATLREAVAWSWDLLSRWEQEALVQSTVFRGGFSLEAAEAILELGADAPAVLDVVQALRTKSLLRLASASPASPRVRVRFYECIREFAMEKSAQHERAPVESRHTDFYLTLAEHLAAAEHGPAEPEALAALSCDIDNFLEVFRHNIERDPSISARIAIALDPMLSTHGPFDLQLSLLERALEAMDTARAPALAAGLLRAYGEALSLRGRLAEAVTVLQRALAAARACGAMPVEARALCALAGTDRVQGRLDDLRRHAEEALALFRRIGDRRGEGIGLTTVGLAHQAARRTEEAHKAHLEALAVHREVHNARFEAIALGRLANVAYRLGRLEEALSSFESALEIQRTVDDRRFEAILLTNVGGIQHDLRQYPVARTCLEAGMRMSREVGDRATEAVAQTFLGSLLLEAGSGAEATRALLASVQVHRELQNVAYEGLAMRFLGHHHLELGEIDDADRCFAEAVRLAGVALDAEGEAMARAYLAVVAQLRGDTDRARESFATARSRLTSAQDPRFQSVVDALEQLAPPGPGSSPDAPIRATVAPSANGARSADTRLATRLVDSLRRRAHQGDLGLPPGAALPRTVGASLRLARDGRWFEIDDQGAVDIARRRSLRRILARLAEHHLAEPGQELSSADLVSVGWPGERLLQDAASRRLRTAIWTLRRMGLHGVLRARGYGYLIDPAARVLWSDP